MKPHTTNTVNPVDFPATQPDLVDVIVVNLVREGINKHRARELAEHFVKHTPPAQPQQETWVERWYGSGPERGWWVCCGRDHIAHLGPSEFAEEAVSKIINAHNTSPPAQRKPLTLHEIVRLTQSLDLNGISWVDVIRAVETAHGIKE